MLKALATAVLLALSGCATSPDCYVGIAIYPPGPFIHCGLDLSPDDHEEELDV